MEKQIRKKRVADISRPSQEKKSDRTSFDKPEKKDAPKRVEKEVEKKLREIDRQVEQFEMEEKKKFEAEEKKKTKKRETYSSKKIIIISSSAVILAVLVYLGIAVLPKADIKITTKKSQWNYIDSVVADKSIAEVSASLKQIPAEVFSLTKNFNFSFPATGKGNVQRKATGKITIYNNYSSAPQTLVATTRFETPDGKIFHLDNRTTVPGKTASGPSSIEASVTADKAGEEYNIAPVDHFNIPGFQGSDKYKWFYGGSSAPMAGGFIGNAAFPTDADIKQAEDSSYNDLKDYIESSLISQIPDGFKLIDGARQFNVTSKQVNRVVDEKGNFAIFEEGQSSIIAFKESDFLDLVSALAQNDLGDDFSISSYQLDYGAGRADFNKGKISFAADFKGVFEQPINIDDFKGKALSKSENDLKTLISSYGNIEKATISFWPFWVKSAPGNPSKVKIETQ